MQWWQGNLYVDSGFAFCALLISDGFSLVYLLWGLSIKKNFWKGRKLLLWLQLNQTWLLQNDPFNGEYTDFNFLFQSEMHNDYSVVWNVLRTKWIAAYREKKGWASLRVREVLCLMIKSWLRSDKAGVLLWCSV